VCDSIRCIYTIQLRILSYQIAMPRIEYNGTLADGEIFVNQSRSRMKQITPAKNTYIIPPPKSTSEIVKRVSK
jgi:hypothetical protein